MKGGKSQSVLYLTLEVMGSQWSLLGKGVMQPDLCVRETTLAAEKDGPEWEETYLLIYLNVVKVPQGHQLSFSFLYTPSNQYLA